MQFSDSVSIDAPRQRVWETLNDPNAIGACVPGLQEVEVRDDGRSFGGQARLDIGASALAFTAHVTWVERDAPHGGILRATAILAGYEIEGNGVVTLLPDGQGSTTMNWQMDVALPPKLAGNALMMQMARMFATRFITAFFQCVQARLEAV